jgi:hypothetical protein
MVKAMAVPTASCTAASTPREGTDVASCIACVERDSVELCDDLVQRAVGSGLIGCNCSQLLLVTLHSSCSGQRSGLTLVGECGNLICN